jgi:hypothetical protein
MSIVATAPAVQTLLRTVKKERPEAWGDAPATCHETFLTSQQARYDQQEAFMIIYDHLCKRFFSKHFRADAPSTIIKHGLLENSPFSSVIFPARNLHSVRGTSQLAAKPLNLGFVFPNVFRSKPECVPRTRGEFEAETPYLWN